MIVDQAGAVSGGPRRRMEPSQGEAMTTNTSRMDSGGILDCVRAGVASQGIWPELELARNLHAGHGAFEGREFPGVLDPGAAGQFSLCRSGSAKTIPR